MTVISEGSGMELDAHNLYIARMYVWKTDYQFHADGETFRNDTKLWRFI